MVTKGEIDAFVDFCRKADDIRVTSATWGRVIPALADENDRLRAAVSRVETEHLVTIAEANETEVERDRLRAQLAEAVALLERYVTMKASYAIDDDADEFFAKLRGAP